MSLVLVPQLCPVLGEGCLPLHLRREVTVFMSLCPLQICGFQNAGAWWLTDAGFLRPLGPVHSPAALALPPVLGVTITQMGTEHRSPRPSSHKLLSTLKACLVRSFCDLPVLWPHMLFCLVVLTCQCC